MNSRFSPIIRNIAVFSFFVLAYLIMFPGVIPNFTKGFLGGSRGDAGIYVWITQVAVHQIFRWPTVGFDAGIFYPFGDSLSYTDNFLLPAFVGWIFQLIGANAPSAYNLTLLLGLVLNGFVTYLLALNFVDDRRVAFYCGFVFMCFPYFVFHRGHPQLQFAFFIPGALLATLGFCEKRRVRDAFLIGACVVGAFLSAVYYSMYCYLLVGVTLLGYLLLNFSTIRLRDCFALLLGNLPWLAVVFLLMGPYQEVEHAFGAVAPSIIKEQSPGFLAYLAAPSVNILWARYTRVLSSFEGYLFFGIISIVLSICSVLQIITATHDRGSSDNGAPHFRGFPWKYLLPGVVVIFAVIGIVTVGDCEISARHACRMACWEAIPIWLALIASANLLFMRREIKSDTFGLALTQKGSLLVFLLVFFLFATRGIIGSRTLTPPFPELYKLLHYLPGFEALRGVSRLGIVPVLIGILLAGIALQGILRSKRWAVSNLRQWSLIGVVLVCSGFELRTKRDIIPLKNPPPPIYKFLQTLPGRDAVLALPIGSLLDRSPDAMNRNSLYMQWIEPSGHPMVNGFSGKVPPYTLLEARKLDDFPSPASLSMIGQLVGVKYVITNRGWLGAERAKEIKRAAANSSDELKLIYCDHNQDCVIEVSPVIHLNQIPDHSLYLHPSKVQERVLNFELRIDSEEALPGREIKIPIIVGSGRSETLSEGREAESIVGSTSWQTFSVGVPPMREAAYYQRVIFSVDPSLKDSNVLIRNVRLSEPN